MIIFKNIGVILLLLLMFPFYLILTLPMIGLNVIGLDHIVKKLFKPVDYVINLLQ